MTRTRARVSLLAIGTALVSLAAPATAAPPAAAAPAPAAGSPRLQALLDELVADGASGAIAVVDDGHRTVRLASGAARLAPRQPLRPDARVRVGSITKTFTATVLLQLVGDGVLRLDDPVSRWLPGMIPNGRAITLRMLLNHTSGLYNYTDDPRIEAAIEHDPTRYWSPQRLVQIAVSHPPTFPPGTSWAYSNTNYVVAGLVIQAATGRSPARLIHQRIVGPLHLAHTSFPVADPTIAGYYAHGYLPPSLTGAGYVDVSVINPSISWTAGAVVSTADDVSRFYSALLGGRLLRPGQLAQMLAVVQLNPVGGYGLGIYTIRGPCGTIWGNDGGVPGYATVSFHDRSGRRSATLALPTQPDANLAALFQLATDTAVCQMFGRVPLGPSTGSGWVRTVLTSRTPSAEVLAAVR